MQLLILLCLPSSYAIKGAPNQKLLLEDIYYAIESRVSPYDYAISSLSEVGHQFPYFRSAPPGWKVHLLFIL